MTVSRLLPIALALGALGLASSAVAGYTATTVPYLPTITGSGLAVNDAWGVQFLNFSTWTRDGADDLFFGSPPPSNLYLRLTGKVTSVSGDQIGYSGTFSIFSYQFTHISELYRPTGSGNFSITSVSDGVGGRTLSGQFVQTGGPALWDTYMPDMGRRYGFNPLGVTGTSNLSGLTTLQLRQTATAVLPPVPEPATLAALSLGTVAILRKRKR